MGSLEICGFVVLGWLDFLLMRSLEICGFVF
jgi:hypothetical protein